MELHSKSLNNHNELSHKRYFVNKFNQFPIVRIIYDVNGLDAIKDYVLNTTSICELLNREERSSNLTTSEVRVDIVSYLIGDVVISATSNNLTLYFKNGDTLADEIHAHANKFEISDEDSYISIIIDGFHGLGLQPVEIPKIDLDITKNYNDDFIEIDAIIKERLNKQKDKGVVLLHGKPGTGKTTYIRHLINSIKKRIIFVPPSLSGTLTSPNFINFLMSYPNSILVIEDAETVIMDRKMTDSNSVSNLLNLSDGLLSDALNIQVICTFNSDLNSIDKALLRKGRIIAKYEFKELSVDKCSIINRDIGIDQDATKPMVLADLYNQDATSFEKKTEKIGF